MISSITDHLDWNYYCKSEHNYGLCSGMRDHFHCHMKNLLYFAREWEYKRYEFLTEYLGRHIL